ncbi:5-oxopent-3-ene-1,2,5-tricarboxylate decarboxylase [Pandoraea terrae]|uniref:5-oxopent-3-ene-1,2,5-tricarboxylate decarboxylase n=1 Tax=Pandoraea terrae TaxID=1537710 RepID=A0A5E4XUG2_9BURK|nr:fumarylacetoacetate hydrolase family protein [Pandoraea terrae]VVE39698.1 5-oxopent-3-ene-1,2,5-tricarboxylate decarboxylase [Pandoraea terrae]
MTWFGIASYEIGGAASTGLVVGDALYDADAILRDAGLSRTIDGGLNLLIDDWQDIGAKALQALRCAAADIASGKLSAVPQTEYRLLLPYTPRRIFATASNYYEHAQEMGTELAPRSESSPYMFMKAESSVVPTLSDVVIPANAERVDWEVELAVVIGKHGRHVTVDNAYDHVAGYTVINDVSARDLNRRTDYPFKHDWFRGKSFDTFGPLGPWFVPRECIAEPQNLRMRLAVNGEMMQDATTAGMIFNIAEQIAYLSSILTLKPGDLIATGTPTGVGMGRGVYLKPGDVMTASIDGIGSIENRVVAA